jgi:hypothetical protein
VLFWYFFWFLHEKLPINLRATPTNDCGFYSIYNSIQYLSEIITVPILKQLIQSTAQELDMALEESWSMSLTSGCIESYLTNVLKFCGFEIKAPIEIAIPSNRSLKLSVDKYRDYLNNVLFDPFKHYNQLLIVGQFGSKLHVIAAFREILTNEFYILDGGSQAKPISASRSFRTGGSAIKIYPLQLATELQLQIDNKNPYIDFNNERHIQAYLSTLNDEDTRKYIINTTVDSHKSAISHRIYDLGVSWMDETDCVDEQIIPKILNELNQRKNIVLGDCFIACFAFYLDQNSDENEREVHYMCAVFSLISLLDRLVDKTESFQIKHLQSRFSVSLFDPMKMNNQSSSYKQHWDRLSNVALKLALSENVETIHPLKPCQANEKEDVFCQTWTLHYLLQRIEGQTHDQVISFYNNLTIPQLDFIEHFARQLVEQHDLTKLITK